MGCSILNDDNKVKMGTSLTTSLIYLLSKVPGVRDSLPSSQTLGP